MMLLLKISIGVVGLLALDQVLTHYADYRIRARDADVPERYAEVKLDWDGEYIKSCAFRYELWIYPYQTCFLVQNAEVNQRAFYTYNQPRPRLALFFRGDNQKNYHFQEITGLNYWKSFDRDNNKFNDHSEQHR